MTHPGFILGTHSREGSDVWPTKLVEKICILCDKTMLVSGYRLDSKSDQVDVASGKEKLLAIECVMDLMGKVAHGMQRSEELLEMMTGKTKP